MQTPITLLIAFLNISGAGAFVGPTRALFANRREHGLSAKKPPIESFDLEAIEAFESTLEQEADDSGEDDDILNAMPGDDVRLYEITGALHNKRIDAAIAALEPDYSRSFCGNLVSDKRVVVVDGEEREMVDRKAYKVQKGQSLEVSFPVEEKTTTVVAQNLPLDILYEDEHMIVLNKAAHMVVHPAAGNWDGTVVNALAYYLANESPYGSGEFINENGEVRDELLSRTDVDVEGTDGEVVSFRPGIVHRLDKGTTGVLVVAKTTQALALLSAAFANRDVRKTYLAVTVGNPGKVTIDKPIGRHPIHRQRMRVVPDPHQRDSSGKSPRLRMLEQENLPPSSVRTGRRAVSHVNNIVFDGKLALVQVGIETGRTHQIRVHLQDRHTPIYGDDIYGLTDWNKRLIKSHQIERPLLHAYRLELMHPVSGEAMTFVAPMPEDMQTIVKTIEPDAPTKLPKLFPQAA